LFGNKGGLFDSTGGLFDDQAADDGGLFDDVADVDTSQLRKPKPSAFSGQYQKVSVK